MRQITPNLGIDLYDATDDAGLVAGYVSAMTKLDEAAGASDVDNVARAAASSAQQDASKALDALGGFEIEHIENTDLGTKWNWADSSIADSSRSYSFHAMIFKIPNTTNAILIGRLAFFTNRQITSADNGQQMNVLTLEGWSEEEEPTSYLPAFTAAVTAGASNALYCVRNRIGVTYNGVNQTIASGNVIQGTIVAFLTKVA